MDPYVIILVTSAASIIASSGFWTYMMKRDGEKKAQSRLMLGLAYDKIATLGMIYIDRGWITKDEYEDFRTYLYEPYKELGGNGTGERIMQQVSTLPLRSHGRYSEITFNTRSERENVHE